MRQSGCAEVLIGFESPGDWGLRGLELKRDWKLRHWQESKEAVRRIQSAGIRVNGCFILGLDGQGPEIFDRVLEFAMETELFDVQITVQTPFPGTPLYAAAEARGAAAPRRSLGDVYALRHQFPSRADDARGAAARFHQPRHATLQRVS